MERKVIIIIVVIALTILSPLFYYIGWLNHTTVNEIGVSYNSLNGDISIQDKPGWYVTNPFVRVGYISTLPITVEIPSSAAVIVKKIVRFKPEGLAEFIRLQGFSYYNNTGLKNIMLGFAFSGNEYLFMEIIQDANVENSSNLRAIDIKGQPEKQEAQEPKEPTAK